MEILHKVYDLPEAKGIARIGARIHDLKKLGHTIEGKRDADKPSIYWYTMVNEAKDLDNETSGHRIQPLDTGQGQQEVLFLS